MIIGLGHRRGVGKNTVAEVMRADMESKGYTVNLCSFASALKATAFDLFSWGGLMPEAYYERNYREKEVILPAIGKSPRTIWIEIGNKMRDVYPEVWIKAALTRSKTDFTIFTDARYPNEFDAIHAAEGLVIKVTNTRAPVHDDVADTAAKEYKMWNDFIRNEGTIEDLKETMEPLLRSIYATAHPLESKHGPDA